MKRTGLSAAEKFERYKDRTLYPRLSPKEQKFLKEICLRYAWTFQEMKQLMEMARDLQMWRESSLEEIWSLLDAQVPQVMLVHERKKYLFNALREKIADLKRVPKRYKKSEGNSVGAPFMGALEHEGFYSSVSKRAGAPTRGAPTAPRRSAKIFGKCPVASPETVCCQLKTIDAIQGCPYQCSYCTIQTFYGDSIHFAEGLREKLKAIRISPGRFYHFGTGQSSDSLALGNRHGMLDDLCEFAAAHPNILLEFKTKSANISYFLEKQIPRNVVCSWSLNSETIIRHEERGTAGLSERLEAAGRVAGRGIKVAFHFHPIVYYDGWKRDYESVISEVRRQFQPEQVLFISLGTVTLIKPVIRKIREHGGFSKILQMEMVPDPHGKLTYPAPLKLELFRTVLEAFKPWRDKVYRYLCMEHAYFWDQIFGWHYPTNDAFEADFGKQVMKKIET